MALFANRELSLGKRNNRVVSPRALESSEHLCKCFLNVCSKTRTVGITGIKERRVSSYLACLETPSFYLSNMKLDLSVVSLFFLPPSCLSHPPSSFVPFLSLKKYIKQASQEVRNNFVYCNTFSNLRNKIDGITMGSIGLQKVTRALNSHSVATVTEFARVQRHH